MMSVAMELRFSWLMHPRVARYWHPRVLRPGKQLAAVSNGWQ